MLAFNLALAVLTVLAGQATAAPAALSKRFTGLKIEIPTDGVAHEGTQEFCLATTGPAADGTTVNFVLCYNTQTTDPTAAGYALWDIAYGNQQGIKLTGTNFCLDAGLNPGPDMVTAKIWTCYPNTPQQQFYYTDDHRIAVTDLTPCLSNGRYGAVFQQCETNPSNIVQDFDLVTPAPSSTTTAAVFTSTTPTSTTSTGAPTASTNAKQLHPNGDSSKCLAVTGGSLSNGAPVGIVDCVDYSNYATAQYQYWLFSEGQTTLSIGNYCVDFGSGSGSNGTPSKIWQCYSGLYQQTLYYTGDKHIAVVGGNQCLDVQAGTSNVQSWQCSGPDVNQLFTT